MSVNKKRVKPKPIKKAEPKKRPAGFKGKKIKEEKPKIDSVKPDGRYVRVPCGNPEKFKAIGERVMLGEVAWSHYQLEGENGVHYFVIRKT